MPQLLNICPELNVTDIPAKLLLNKCAHDVGYVLQRFEFRPTLEGCGETHPDVIPVGPRYGMPMRVSQTPS